MMARNELFSKIGASGDVCIRVVLTLATRELFKIVMENIWPCGDRIRTAKPSAVHAIFHGPSVIFKPANVRNTFELHLVFLVVRGYWLV